MLENGKDWTGWTEGQGLRKETLTTVPVGRSLPSMFGGRTSRLSSIQKEFNSIRHLHIRNIKNLDFKYSRESRGSDKSLSLVRKCSLSTHVQICNEILWLAEVSQPETKVKNNGSESSSSEQIFSH